MNRLLWLASWRHMLRHPWQLALAVLGVALGIAVVVAVDLANEAARHSFKLSTDQVAGRATHQIVASGQGIPEDFYRQLRVELGVHESAPVVEGDVALATAPGRTFRLLGLDILAERPLRGGMMARNAGNFDPAALFSDPSAVIVPKDLAEELRLVQGSELELLAGPGTALARVIGVADAGAADAELRGLLLADVGAAQALLGRVGFLTRIDLVLNEEDADTVDTVRRHLPPGTRLERSETRNRSVAQLSDSFHLNLTAMSLLAMLVGLFLIYNTMTFSVIQRRDLLGRLRALGVGRREIFAVVTLEALLLGLAGTALGLTLGIVLGGGLLDLVARTIDDLYYTLPLRQFHLAPLSLLKGLVLGTVATLAAACFPAWEAAATEPGAVLRRSDLETRIRRRLPLLTLLGALFLLAGALVLLVPGGGLLFGFAALFILVMGCALLVPPAVRILGRGLELLCSHLPGAIPRMASRDVSRHLSRTGVAVAALTVAVSSAVGVGLMVNSFRSSVTTWLESVLNADLYLAPVSIVTGDDSVFLRPEVIEALAQISEIKDLSLYQGADVTVAGRISRLLAIDLSEQSRRGYRFLSGNAEPIWGLFETTRSVLISEPMAYHHGLKVGDPLTLATMEGQIAFGVAGIFRDYGSEHGRVFIRRELYQRYWQDERIRTAALFTDSVDLEELVRRIEEETGPLQPLSLSPSRDIRERSLEIFDRTFLITGVLRVLAVVVAFVGVLSALLAMLMERSREFAILRANGVTPWEILFLLSLESGFLGLTAGVLAIPTGLLLANVLVHVINQRAFGWTMALTVDPLILMQALVLALLAALMAGLYPAWRAARSRPAANLRID